MRKQVLFFVILAISGFFPTAASIAETWTIDSRIDTVLQNSFRGDIFIDYDAKGSKIDFGGFDVYVNSIKILGDNVSLKNGIFCAAADVKNSEPMLSLYGSNCSIEDSKFDVSGFNIGLSIEGKRNLISGNEIVYENIYRCQGIIMTINAEGNIIQNNNLRGGFEFAILSCASQAKILGNSITAAYTGIYLSGSGLGLVEENTLSNQTWDIMILGKNNTINKNIGKIVVVLVGEDTRGNSGEENKYISRVEAMHGADLNLNSFGSTEVEISSRSVVGDYGLEQNFPNPFNPQTTISYSLPNAGEVNLTVYDLRGRQVAELVNGFKQAGQHQTVFDAAELPTGTYFYLLKTEGFSKRMKMVLTK